MRRDWAVGKVAMNWRRGAAGCKAGSGQRTGVVGTDVLVWVVPHPGKPEYRWGGTGVPASVVPHPGKPEYRWGGTGVPAWAGHLPGKVEYHLGGMGVLVWAGPHRGKSAEWGHWAIAD
jgi:hypothetical protein